MNNHQFQTIIGLEIHIALLSHAKTFSNTKFDSYSWKSLGFPGVLSQINFDAILKTIRLASHLKCEINHENICFDRKNYFYYDLPKGYQITQYFHPMGKNGKILLKGNKEIKISQIHLEEDTAKQTKEKEKIFLDFARLGNPLVEVVTGANFETFEEVKEFLWIIRSMCLFLGLSNCEYENGEMRVDLNISIFDKQTGINTAKSEIKNMNSLTAIENAIKYQTDNLIKKIKNNENIESFTYSWNERLGICEEQRKKTGSSGYLYIPESNIPKIKISKEKYQEIISKDKDFFDFLSEIEMSKINNKEFNNMMSRSDLLQHIISLNNYLCDWKKSYIWIADVFEGLINSEEMQNKKEKFNFSEVEKLILLIENKEMKNIKNAKLMIKEILLNNTTYKDAYKKYKVDEIKDEKKIWEIMLNILHTNDSSLKKLSENMLRFEKFIVGQTIKETQGKANPQLATEIFKKNIKDYLIAKNVNYF